MSVKRFLDILLAGIGLVIFLPFGLIIVMILGFTGEREIFYVQERVGKGGKPFGFFKFATMIKGSTRLGAGEITLRNDPRVLPFGKFLRKTKLNEVPQLINVLKGDMSIVGPRPQPPSYIAFFPEETRTKIIDLNPGLTGVGSIIFRDEDELAANSGMDPTLFHKQIIAPCKGELETWYREHQNLHLDVKLIVLTAWMLFLPDSTRYQSFLPELPTLPSCIGCSGETDSC